jgi:hypothetical protein
MASRRSDTAQSSRRPFSSMPAATQVGLAQWQRYYELVLQERDRKSLFKRIEVAEAAIHSRQELLTQSADGFTEREEIEQALLKLTHLKKKVLNFEH